MLASLLLLVGCSDADNAKVSSEPATNFVFDMISGEYSFTGTADADYYFLRVFELDQTTNQMAEMPSAAARVMAQTESTSYTGGMTLVDLEPGHEYEALVYSYVKEETGQLSYAVSEGVTGVYIGTYEAPTSGMTITLEGEKLNIVLEDGLCSAYVDAAEPTLLLTVYKDGNKYEEISVLWNELEQIETQSEMWGMVQVSTETTGHASINIDDATAVYTVSTTVISTNEVVYFDSVESEQFQIVSEEIPVNNE